MKKILLLSLIAVALLAPGISKAQKYVIPNGSFENWSSQTAPLNWIVGQGIVQEVSLVPWYTTDGKGDTSRYEVAAKDGSKAIEMFSDGPKPCVVAQRFAFTGRPQYWSANLGYFPSSQNDNFYGYFYMTKWNPAKVSKHDTILKDSFASPRGAAIIPWQTIVNASLASGYNPNLSGTEMPDTAFIIIVNSILGAPSPLAIDRIWFSDTAITTGIDLNDFSQFNPSGISAYPNPFSEKTTIHYNLTQSGEVSLNVFDINGKQVATLVNGNQESGPHDATFDASGLKNGVYFYRLQSANDSKTGKLMLAR